MNNLTLECRISDMEKLPHNNAFTQGLWLKLHEKDPNKPFVIDAYIPPGQFAKDIHDYCGPQHILIVSGTITGGTPNIQFHLEVEDAIRTITPQETP